MLPLVAARRIAAMRRAGIVNPVWTYLEARRAGLPLRLACALLDQESGGGHNVFGHDPSIYAGAGAVTEAKYRAYKAARGQTRMQGVGPCQLTWWSTQDKADYYGGCWKPRFNMRVGFELLAGNIRRYGLRDGIRAYNGSGPAAEHYATSVLNRAALWDRRLP